MISHTTVMLDFCGPNVAKCRPLKCWWYTGKICTCVCEVKGLPTSECVSVCVIISQACVLTPSQSTWTFFSSETRISHAQPDKFDVIPLLEMGTRKPSDCKYLLDWNFKLYIELRELSVRCCSFWVKTVNASAFVVFLSSPWSYSLTPSSGLSVGFISYAHCISGPLWVLWQTKEATISVSRIYREALLQLACLVGRNVS